MSRVNPKLYDINMMDGNAFLTWLQKLGRVSEDILLGNIAEKSVTLDQLNFSEPPTPSAVASLPSSSVRGSSSPQPGLSLPNIKSHRPTSASPSALFALSPSAEIVSSERSVSRGVGSNESLSPSILSRAFSPPRSTTTGIGTVRGDSVASPPPSIHSLSESPPFDHPSSVEDPYLRYMTNTFRTNGSHSSSNRVQRNLPQLYREGSPPAVRLMGPHSPSSSCCTSPHALFDGNEGSIVSAVTDSSSLMFSPIRPHDPLDPDSSSLSSSSKRQPMVASLLGNNPWTGLDSAGARRRERRGKGGDKKKSKGKNPQISSNSSCSPSLLSSSDPIPIHVPS
jgi:hypothetical protein